MLPGVVPFPPEFAARYRARGYWQNKSLRDEFSGAWTEFSGRTALIDGDRHFNYADIDRLTDNLALNLLELGLKPLDRVVPTLPNTAEFVLLYFALQKIGGIPIAAMVTHRYTEIRQFVRITQAVACVYPERHGNFVFSPTIKRVAEENPCLRFRLVCGRPGIGELSLAALIETPARLSRDHLTAIRVDPTDPCVFQLSSGSTGIPKLIPRTHNDYAYNSRAAAAVCEINGGTVLLLALPIAHNLPLACPGIQGCFFNGGTVVLSPTTKPEDIFSLVAKHRVTHVKVVPTLLIRLINSAEALRHNTSSVRLIQSGGQRLQPQVRLRTRALFPTAFVQENFGMSEGMLFFVRRGDPEDVQLDTVGRPISPDDEVRLLGDDGQDVAFGKIGELCVRGPYTLRGYYSATEYNEMVFMPDGFYRSGDLMRQHSSGNYLVEGRKKDLINRGGEKISAEEIENLILQHRKVENAACIAVPDATFGERMCACVILHKGKNLTLAELVTFLASKEIAGFKLPERLVIMDEFPLSTLGKVSKRALIETVSKQTAPEL